MYYIFMVTKTFYSMDALIIISFRIKIHIIKLFGQIYIK